MKYRSKPEEVEAFRFCEESEITGPEWFAEMVKAEKAYIDRSIVDGASKVYGCSFYLTGSRTKAKIGDYIIRWPSGAVTVERPGDFCRRFEKMEGKRP